jgi:hypothetical protein
MKLFMEADFAKGSGAIRWEGVTTQRLRRLVTSALALVATAALIAGYRFW